MYTPLSKCSPFFTKAPLEALKTANDFMKEETSGIEFQSKNKGERRKENKNGLENEAREECLTYNWRKEQN